MATLALSAAAFVVAVYTSLRPAPAAVAPACEHHEIEQALARLADRIATTERVVARSAVRRAGETMAAPPRAVDPGGSGDGGTDETLAADALDPDRFRTAPRYERLDAPAGIEVTQNDDGSFVVRNTDPALSNQLVMVKARRDDGTIDDVPVTVPPPS